MKMCIRLKKQLLFKSTTSKTQLTLAFLLNLMPQINYVQVTYLHFSEINSYHYKQVMSYSSYLSKTNKQTKTYLVVPQGLSSSYSNAETTTRRKEIQTPDRTMNPLKRPWLFKDQLGLAAIIRLSVMTLFFSKVKNFPWTLCQQNIKDLSKSYRRKTCVFLSYTVHH